MRSHTLAITLSLTIAAAACSSNSSDAEGPDNEEASSSESAIVNPVVVLDASSRRYAGEFAAVALTSDASPFSFRGLSLWPHGGYMLFKNGGFTEQGTWKVVSHAVPSMPGVSKDVLHLSPLSGIPYERAIRATTDIEGGFVLTRADAPYQPELIKRLTFGKCTPGACDHDVVGSVCSEVSLLGAASGHACVEDWLRIAK